MHRPRTISGRTTGRTAAPALWLLCALPWVACNSTPEVRRVLAVTDADAVEVSFWSGANGQLLAMRNAGAAVQAAAAKTRPAATNSHELDGNEMQKLLDALATYEFFELAKQPRSARSKSALTVEVNGKQYVATGAQPDATNLQRWTNCVATFTEVFNRTGELEVKLLKAKDSDRLKDDLQRHSTEPAKGSLQRKSSGPENGK